MDETAQTLVAKLPERQRLALNYAPGPARAALGVVFALDARLAGIVRNSREPMLAQLRLAWWREQLSGEDAGQTRGDPLLDALGAFTGDRQALVAMVDGWEGMTGAAPLAGSAFTALAEARAGALASSGGTARHHADAVRLGRNWSLADTAMRLTDPVERQRAMDLAHAQDWRGARLSRSLRPLAILHALAARDLRHGGNPTHLSSRDLLVVMRVGTFGI